MPDIQEDVKESKAKIEELAKRIDALTKIMVKEGITTEEEADEMTQRLIEGKDE